MSVLLTNNIELFYEIRSEGPPLILIAGLASDSQSWEPVMGSLSENFKVISLDNRGVGRTIHQDIDISIEKMTDDCISLLGHLGLESVHVLGHSMGGFVALDMAGHALNVENLDDFAAKVLAFLSDKQS
jgi:pimeloyl-ACP methyl ester carboxylesterase